MRLRSRGSVQLAEVSLTGQPPADIGQFACAYAAAFGGWLRSATPALAATIIPRVHRGQITLNGRWPPHPAPPESGADAIASQHTTSPDQRSF